jgi:hypothetical protein
VVRRQTTRPPEIGGIARAPDQRAGVCSDGNSRLHYGYTHRTWISRIRLMYRDIRKQREEIDARSTQQIPDVIGRG